mgnify:CR=1 FL=1
MATFTMKILLHDGHHYVLRFDRGEEVIASLGRFAVEEKITAATFTALGAAGKTVLAYYDLEKKVYIDKVLEEDLEIASVVGNIGVKGEAPAVHAHGCLSDASFKTYSGHIKEMRVSVTCEVSLMKLEGVLERVFDAESGLNLMK